MIPGARSTTNCVAGVEDMAPLCHPLQRGRQPNGMVMPGSRGKIFGTLESRGKSWKNEWRKAIFMENHGKIIYKWEHNGTIMGKSSINGNIMGQYGIEHIELI